MFMLEDMENFLMFRSLAASIAALLWGGFGSLHAHINTSLSAPPCATACHAGVKKDGGMPRPHT